MLHCLSQLSFPNFALAVNPEWQSIDPLHQHCLSQTIDEAQYDALLANSPDPLSRALALSSTIAHAGDCLGFVLLQFLDFMHVHDHEFCFCRLYWLGLPMTEEGLRCTVVIQWLTPMGQPDFLWS